MHQKHVKHVISFVWSHKVVFGAVNVHFNHERIARVPDHTQEVYGLCNDLQKAVP